MLSLATDLRHTMDALGWNSSADVDKAGEIRRGVLRRSALFRSAMGARSLERGTINHPPPPHTHAPTHRTSPLARKRIHAVPSPSRVA